MLNYIKDLIGFNTYTLIGIRDGRISDLRGQRPELSKRDAQRCCDDFNSRLSMTQIDEYKVVPTGHTHQMGERYDPSLPNGDPKNNKVDLFCQGWQKGHQ